jgi:hypothetical protein
VIIGHTGYPDPVKPSFEDGRHAEPPGWKNKDNGFSGKQPCDLLGNSIDPVVFPIIADPFLPAEYRIEDLLIEIFNGDSVAGNLEVGHYPFCKSRAEAFLQRMGADDKALH